MSFAEKVDPAYKPIFKQSQCDAQGNFAFTNLPTGGWFVATEVKWTVGNAQQGGTLMRSVSTVSSEQVQVLLTDADFAGR